ncbi:MAG: lanthionine synthetase LanC family protein [Cyclobacteriaceae bacterium]
MEPQEHKLLQEAIRIGDQLVRESRVDRHGRYWKTADQVGKETRWAEHTCLYNGVSGIALFLLILYQQTQEERFLNAALEALEWAEHRSDSENGSSALLTGRLSLPFVWLRAHQVLGDNHALTQALTGTHRLLPQEHANMAAEYINGISGTVIALLHLHHATQDGRILQELDRCVDQLLSMVQYHPEGIYWDRSGLHIRGLCGFSHGASGVGYAFLELGHYFQNPAFFWIAEEAFRYERAYYHPEIKNWPDFRKSALTEEDERTFSAAYHRGDLNFFTQGAAMNAWCHGAAGIGLSRLRAYEWLEKRIYHDEALWSLEKTAETDLSSEGSATFTLCHGRGGNADIFVEAYQVLGDARYWHQAQQVAAVALRFRQQKVYRSGTRYEGEDASLFNGNAGIGYFYLRTLFPREVPSILAPKQAAIYSGSLHSEGCATLALSQAEVQERLVARRFPRTLHLIKAIGEHKVQHSCASQFPMYRRSHWQDLVSQQVNNLPLTLREKLLDAWKLEDTRAALDEHIVSNALLQYKQQEKIKDAVRLLSLKDSALAKEKLCLDTDVALLTTSWDWSHTATHWENSLQKPAGDYAILLNPTLEGIQEHPLNAFVHTLFEAFVNEKTVADGMQIVREQIADPADKSEVENVILQQTRAAIRACLLIAPKVHPLQVTSQHLRRHISPATL